MPEAGGPAVEVTVGDLTLPQTAGLLVLVAISCLVAQRAGGYPGAWTWGFMGPIGWILAGMEAIRTKGDDTPRRGRGRSGPRGR